MIKGYRDFYYNVKDMNKAIAFYSEALRIKKTYGHEHWTTMTLGNLSLGLHWTGGKILGEADQDWGHMLAFEDVDGNVIKLMKPKY